MQDATPFHPIVERAIDGMTVVGPEGVNLEPDAAAAIANARSPSREAVDDLKRLAALVANRGGRRAAAHLTDLATTLGRRVAEEETKREGCWGRFTGAGPETFRTVRQRPPRNSVKASALQAPRIRRLR